MFTETQEIGKYIFEGIYKCKCVGECACVFVVCDDSKCMIMSQNNWYIHKCKQDHISEHYQWPPLHGIINLIQYSDALPVHQKNWNFQLE